MKKVDFVVIFWLILAIISFSAFLIAFASFWSSISYILIPSTYMYMTKEMGYRNLISSGPMLIVSAITFAVSVKQGLKFYKE